MTGNASDAQIDRLVKAGWLKMGLSPNDLAEVFDAVLQPRTRQDRDEGHVDADRLTAIGHALEMPIDTVRHKGRGTSQPDAGQPEAKSVRRHRRRQDYPRQAVFLWRVSGYHQPL